MIRWVLLLTSVGFLLAGWVGWRQVHTPRDMSAAEAVAAAERGERRLVRVEAYDGKTGAARPLRALRSSNSPSLAGVPPAEWKEFRGARVRMPSRAAGGELFLMKTTRAPASSADPDPVAFKHASLLVPLKAEGVWALSPPNSWPSSVTTVTEKLSLDLSPSSKQAEWACLPEFEGVLLRFEDLRRDDWSFARAAWRNGPLGPKSDDWVLDASKTTRVFVRDAAVYFEVPGEPGRVWLTVAQVEDGFFDGGAKRTQLTGVLQPRGADQLPTPAARDGVEFGLLVVESHGVEAALREMWFRHWGLKSVSVGGVLLLVALVVFIRRGRATP